MAVPGGTRQQAENCFLLGLKERGWGSRWKPGDCRMGRATKEREVWTASWDGSVKSRQTSHSSCTLIIDLNQSHRGLVIQIIPLGPQQDREPDLRYTRTTSRESRLSSSAERGSRHVHMSSQGAYAKGFRIKLIKKNIPKGPSENLEYCINMFIALMCKCIHAMFASLK